MRPRALRDPLLATSGVGPRLLLAATVMAALWLLVWWALA